MKQGTPDSKAQSKTAEVQGQCRQTSALSFSFPLLPPECRAGPVCHKIGLCCPHGWQSCPSPIEPLPFALMSQQLMIIPGCLVEQVLGKVLVYDSGLA